MTESVNLYLSQYLGVDPSVLDEYGAFDISVASDLPLFIDPFLIFHSDKNEYQALHQGILTYLVFLRDKAATGQLTPALIASWYEFKEVKRTSHVVVFFQQTSVAARDRNAAKWAAWRS